MRTSPTTDLKEIALIDITSILIRFQARQRPWTIDHVDSQIYQFTESIQRFVFVTSLRTFSHFHVVFRYLEQFRMSKNDEIEASEFKDHISDYLHKYIRPKDTLIQYLFIMEIEDATGDFSTALVALKE